MYLPRLTGCLSSDAHNKIPDARESDTSRQSHTGVIKARDLT